MEKLPVISSPHSSTSTSRINLSARNQFPSVLRNHNMEEIRRVSSVISTVFCRELPAEKLAITKQTCSICFDEINIDEFPNLCCFDHKSNDACISCFKLHIESIIKSASIGTCPPIYCPLIHEDESGKPFKRLLHYKNWSKVVDEGVLQSHDKLCESILSFRCCNPVSSTHIKIPLEYFESESAKATKYLVDTNKFIDNTSYIALIAQLKQFMTAEVHPDILFKDIVNTYFPSKFNDEKFDSWDLMRNILHLIDDPERRACLQLRYYNRYPRFRGHCCTTNHCFRCKSSWHGGRSCDTFTAGFINDIAICPHCALHLTRSEGCDDVA